MAVAGVVAREVADHADAALVRRLDQADVGLIAAEQRVDREEARRVVAVIGCRREDRRQVEEVDAELDEVVELVDDAVEVAAVELLRAAGHDGSTGSFHAAGIAQSGVGWASACADRANRSGNTWYITASYSHAGGAGIGDEREVLGIQRLDRVQPGLIQPLDASVLVLQHPAVAVARVAHRRPSASHQSQPSAEPTSAASVHSGSWSGFERVRTAASGP